MLLIGIFSKCEKEVDIILPKINILSPLEKKIYSVKIIPVQWEIEEENFKSAWCSVNDKGEFLLPSQIGSINWYFKNGENKLVIGAEDLYSNAAKDSITFYVNYLIKR